MNHYEADDGLPNWATRMCADADEHFIRMIAFGAALRETIADHVKDPKSVEMLNDCTRNMAGIAGMESLALHIARIVVFPSQTNGETEPLDGVREECDHCINHLLSIIKFMEYMKLCAMGRADGLLDSMKTEGSA